MVKYFSWRSLLHRFNSGPEPVESSTGFAGFVAPSTVAASPAPPGASSVQARIVADGLPLGVILRTLPRAGRPPMPPPDIVFPAAEFGRWESGQPVNRLVTDAPQDGDTHDETLS
jgi:hypothetical protein